MTRLAGKVALITGAARGVGASIARLFHDQGACIVVADVRASDGEALATALGSRALYVKLDVADEASWQGAVASTLDQFKRMDVLVNNAGIYRVRPIEELSAEEYLQTVRVNQLGCFLGMKHVIAPIAAAGGGAIVNIASTAGIARLTVSWRYQRVKATRRVSLLWMS